MKKILLSILFTIGVFSFSNVYACKTCGCQKDAKKECTGSIEKSLEDDATKGCEKSKKECCKSKKKSSCSKSSKKSSCSKSSKEGFNFNKSNNYGEKKTCSKKVKKCCKKQAAISDEEAPSEEAPVEETEEKE